ncbi:MAG: flagellar filament capping protein FliD [Terracidiphilus sp.]|jgi:flagellar hook-associated protein 2
MGTVGLSFGSPTSGAGFNVSSTVAEIVGNLKNVETPWKSQLTSLQSQDTAISSLGTLFSNLSNDMSSLTDFQGVLALKGGSSSDENVLTLTAADSTAVSGTYTVEVANLAQTSSGYLTQIANADAPLTGSITVQGASGTQLNITLNSSDNTLAGLASTISSSGLGINASVLTDSSGSMLSLVSATSGAAGDISVPSISISATNSTTLAYTGTAGSGTTPASGSLAALANTSDTLSGSLTIQSGSGATETIVIGGVPASGQAAHTIYTGSGNNTLTGLENTIKLNPTVLGVTASIVASSSGAQSLSLTSNSSSSGTLNVVSSINDITGTTSLTYNNPVQGKDANLTVDGVALTSASNTVANLIPGVTFQLLAPSTTGEQVQVVIANNNSGVESTVSQMVSDYNSLVSAMNTQEGNDSSGNPEPLFGSPTLSLLQQQLMSSLNLQNPNGTMTGISADTNTTLSGSMSITVGSGTAVQVIVGSGTNTANTIYTGSGSGSNTLSGLAAAINAAGAGTMLSSTVAAGSGMTASTATLTPVASGSDPLSGSITIQVGSGDAQTIVIGAKPASPAADTYYTGSGINTLSGLASAITSADIGVSANVTTASDGVATLELTSGTTGSGGTLTVTPNVFAAGFGVTAGVVTADGQSTLTLASQTAGSSGGGLTVTSGIVATSDTPLSFTTTAATTDSAYSSAGSSEVAGENDVLSGTISIQVGSGSTMTISVPSSPNNNLSGLAEMIGEVPLGVTASVVQNADGSYGLSLTSSIAGSDGDLTVTSNILDATNTNRTTLAYTNSSDINSLTGLGISVNNDGSLTFDATSMDSVLNTDYSGVVGFFQNASSWGQSFSTMLTNAGTSSPTGILSLATGTDSSIESTLNANVSKEEMLISAQQTSLTAELNSANEIMQELPTQLEGVNELYSAITGYNQNTNG